MVTHQVVARNYSEASENKIHSDAIARKCRCVNDQGVLLAELASELADALPAAESQGVFDAPAKRPGRPELTWDTLVLHQPFAPWHWQITEDANRAYASQVGDDLPVYRTAAHPHWLLGMANRALSREYVMPAFHTAIFRVAE